MTIGDRIKNRRKFLMMSADELGKRLGKDRSTIYRYEKGDIENLPLDILEPIAVALETTPQYLMGWDEKTASENGTEEAKKNSPPIYDGLSEKQKAFIDKVMQMSDAELDRVDKILSLVENTK